MICIPLEKNSRKNRIIVKCKFYYWGFCKLTPADENHNRDYCKQDKCKMFKIKKTG